MLAPQALATRELPLYKLYVSDISYDIVLFVKVSQQVERGLEQTKRSSVGASIAASDSSETAIVAFCSSL